MNDTDCNLVIKKKFFCDRLLNSSHSFNSNGNGNSSPLNNFPIFLNIKTLFSIRLILKPDSILFHPASLGHSNFDK